MSEQSEPPPQPPRPPQFIPGQAGPPPADPSSPGYPPTSQFPPVDYAPPVYQPDAGVPGYPPAPYAGGDHPPPGHPAYGPPPPRRSNTPLIALIIAVSLLLCGGVVTSGVLITRSLTEKAKEAVEPIVNPTLPTELPQLPGLPTDLPGLPTDLPGLPTDLPTGLPGVDEGKEVSVTYEVSGDGPAEILYTGQLGTTPKLVNNVDLPWEVTTTMKGAGLVSVTAQRLDGGSGSISCRAEVDGETVAEQTADGEWATITCNKLMFN